LILKISLSTRPRMVSAIAPTLNIITQSTALSFDLVIYTKGRTFKTIGLKSKAKAKNLSSRPRLRPRPGTNIPALSFLHLPPDFRQLRHQYENLPSIYLVTVSWVYSMTDPEVGSSKSVASRHGRCWRSRVSIESIDVGKQRAHHSRDARTHILGRQAREMPRVHIISLKTTHTLLVLDLDTWVHSTIQMSGLTWHTLHFSFTFCCLEEPEKLLVRQKCP